MIRIVEKYLTFENSCIFADFELDAYAQLDVEVELDAPAELDLALGEVAADGRVEREPGGYRIIRTMQKSCPAGKSAFAFDYLNGLPGIKSVSGMGLMIGILPSKRSASDIVKSCMEKGVLCLTA